MKVGWFMLKPVSVLVLYNYGIVIVNIMKQETNMFNNKVAVVTGGTSGIGKIICEEFQKEGANICVIDKTFCCSKYLNNYIRASISEI